MEGQTISLLEASAKLGISTATLYKWKNKGRVEIIAPQPAKIRVSEVDRLLAERKGAHNE